MRTGRYIFALIALFIAAAAFGADDSKAAQVICSHKKKGVLKLRQEQCEENEIQVDLSDIAEPQYLNPTRWSWLGEGEGTYWYVPPVNLPAVQWDSSDPTNYFPVSDQTVWHVESYADGYFFGTVVVQFGTGSPACQYLIGSVTPDGGVYIAFNPLSSPPIGSPTLTTGSGKMAFKDGEWTFLMQMASGISSTQVAHWAYMLECTPDEECWENLPGVERGIEEFLSNCEAE
jgi:hypothetical protein